MANTILEDVKISLGIMPDNLGFDLELLIFLNSIKVSLVQLGVDDMDINIDETVGWPVWTNDTVGGFTKHYILVKARQAFDPTASETIAKTFEKSAVELEGRLAHEVEENV
jgi:hypothetical protein